MKDDVLDGIRIELFDVHECRQLIETVDAARDRISFVFEEFQYLTRHLSPFKYKVFQAGAISDTNFQGARLVTFR
jgi:hypothetical protein